MVGSRRAVLLAISVVSLVALAPPPLASAPASSISGTVLDGDGAPLAGITVTVASSTTTVQVTTAGDGTYLAEPLPDGAYTVGFADVDGIAPQHPTQFWPAAWSMHQAGTVTIESGSAVADVDAALPVAASLSGRITDAEGAPVEGVCANAWQRDGDEQRWLGNTLAAVDGTYEFAALPPVQVVVEYQDCVLPMTWLTRFHGQSSEFSAATGVVLVPGAEVAGIDGHVDAGGAIAGTARDAQGAPVADMCVSAAVAGPGGASAGQTDATGADGTYQLDQLESGEYVVTFEPCDEEPYLPARSGSVAVAAGAVSASVDAALERATVVDGTVRDGAGQPLEGICVQASDAARIGGSDETDVDGRYHLAIAGGGSFNVQAVDCRDTASTGPANVELELAAGSQRSGVDLTMIASAPAGVGGRVTNVRGEPLAGLCVFAYLPHQELVSTLTDSSGGYSIQGLGAGEWSVAFLSCAAKEDDAAIAPVYDGRTGVFWAPQWWGGEVLAAAADTEPGPDPVAQGADLLSLEPGSTTVLDHCFGCELVVAELVLDGSTIRASARASGVDLGAAAAEYSMVCVPEGEVAADSVLAASGPDGELVIEGARSDTRYGCAVAVEVAGLVVARSATEVVSGSDVPPAGGTGDDPGDGARDAAATLAFVG